MNRSWSRVNARVFFAPWRPSTGVAALNKLVVLDQAASSWAFAPLSLLPKRPPRRPLLAPAPPSDATRVALMGYTDFSVRPTLRTRKAVLRLAARKAVPSAHASSPFRCCPSVTSRFQKPPPELPQPSSFSCFSMAALTAGMRTLPPMSSISWICDAFMPAICSASKIGCETRGTMSLVACSNSARVTWDRKSMSLCRPSMFTGISALALRISLTLRACSRSLAMDLELPRTSSPPLSCRLNLSARISVMARSNV
mmetsp:Transcript_13735/g.51248  ORF Transcript_13735/g.51248 Transcript_13735/m.51248 type:complete len:255 (-) Transcript_13735:126-890(-)